MHRSKIDRIATQAPETVVVVAVAYTILHGLRPGLIRQSAWAASSTGRSGTKSHISSHGRGPARLITSWHELGNRPHPALVHQIFKVSRPAPVHDKFHISPARPGPDDRPKMTKPGLVNFFNSSTPPKSAHVAQSEVSSF